jgi:hypothetical protein
VTLDLVEALFFFFLHPNTTQRESTLNLQELMPEVVGMGFAAPTSW